MNCQDVQQLLHAYLDGELDVVKSLEIEQHLRDCPACSQVYHNQQVVHNAIQANAVYYAAPASLRKRVQTAVRQADSPAPASRVRTQRWLSVAAALFALVLVVWGVTRIWPVPTSNDTLTQEVIASHIRSLMPNHLADVASSDQHTVKPWFDGKLDFAPTVTDFAGQGFPLTGGRLDYLDDRPVAALIYKRQQHVINVFTWPSPGAVATSPTATVRQGYHVIHWTQPDMTYWAVSDLNETELLELVHLIQNQPPP